MASDRDKATGTAQAAGGAVLAAGTPAVSRIERAVQGRRVARVDRKIARVKASMPTKPDPSIRLAGGRYRAEHPRQKYQRQAKVRQLHGDVSRLNAKRNKMLKPKLYHKQTRLWAAGLAAGVPISYMGARRASDPVKKWDRRDTNAAYVGGAGGFAAYQGGSMALKPLDRRAERKIRENPDLLRRQRDYQSKHRPKKMAAGDPRWRPYFRNYPKDLPGGRLKRVQAVTHTGKSGGALTVAAMGVGGAGAVAANRKRHQVSKARAMSDAEIRRRKKAQGHISQTTSTLGLAGLGVTGGAALAARKPGVLRAVQRLPRMKTATPEKMKNAAINTGIISGGIGGVGGYNFAAYTGAESKRRKQTVGKSMGIDAGYFGEEGHRVQLPEIEAPVEKAWSPVASSFDSESSRQKRSKTYQGAALVGAGAGGAYAGHHGAHAVREGRKLRAIPDVVQTKKVSEEVKGQGGSYRRNVTRAAGKPFTALDAGQLKVAGKHGGKALAGVGAVGAAVGAHEAIRRRRKGGWQPYAKRDQISAFGVDHTEWTATRD